jgi:hypothetical protein
MFAGVTPRTGTGRCPCLPPRQRWRDGWPMPLVNEGDGHICDDGGSFGFTSPTSTGPAGAGQGNLSGREVRKFWYYTGAGKRLPRGALPLGEKVGAKPPDEGRSGTVFSSSVSIVKTLQRPQNRNFASLQVPEGRREKFIPPSRFRKQARQGSLPLFRIREGCKTRVLPLSRFRKQARQGRLSLFRIQEVCKIEILPLFRFQKPIK